MSGLQKITSLLVKSFVYTLCDKMWPNLDLDYLSKVDLSRIEFVGNIKERFDVSGSNISWEEFLQDACSIHADLGRTEYGMCKYIHSIFMQILSRDGRYIKIYSKTGASFRNISILCQHLTGFSINYDISVDVSDVAIISMIASIDRKKMSKICTVGVTKNNEVHDIIITMDNIVVCVPGFQEASYFCRYNRTEMKKYFAGYN